jgi:hypothetical protein
MWRRCRYFWNGRARFFSLWASPFQIFRLGHGATIQNLPLWRKWRLWVRPESGELCGCAGGAEQSTVVGRESCICVVRAMGNAAEHTAENCKRIFASRVWVFFRMIRAPENTIGNHAPCTSLMIRLRLPTSLRWPIPLRSGADANELAAMHDPAKKECGQTRPAHPAGRKSLLKGCAS